MNLSDYLAAERGRAKRLAAALGVTRAYVYQLSTGRRPVNLQRAIEIQNATGGEVSVPELLPDVPWGEAVPLPAKSLVTNGTPGVVLGTTGDGAVVIAEPN